MSYGYNSTINRKKKICRSCGREAYIFSKNRCSDCSRIEDTQKKMEQESERVIEQENLSELISVADAIFSQYVRLSYADEKGYVQCFTCDSLRHWTLMQCGHYIKRGNLFLRFDLRHCRVQCEPCNYNQKTDGEKAKFTVGLEKENPGITEILNQEAVLPYKPYREEIRAIITEYTPKVRELKNKLKAKK